MQQVKNKAEESRERFQNDPGKTGGFYKKKKKKKKNFSSGILQKRIQKRAPPSGNPFSSHPPRLPHRSRAQNILPDQVVPVLVLQNDGLELLPPFIDQDVDDSGVCDGGPSLEEGRDVSAELCGRGHVLEAVVLDGPGDEAADLGVV